MSILNEKPVLINNVISAVGLDGGMSKGKYTTAWSVPLVNNEDGVHAIGSFNYSSALGMLLYLSWHTHPDIACAVNC